MGTFTSLLIYKKIDFSMPIDKFVNSLSGDSNYGFTIEESGFHEYKVLANISYGTLMVKGMVGVIDGIKLYMTTDSNGETATEVIIRTRLRIEVIFSLIIGAIIFVASLKGSDSGLPHGFIGLALLLPIWFWFVYRLQEYFLLTKIEKYLASL